MEIKTVSLVLPMFNEKFYLAKAVAEARAVLESIVADFEIIIVDDASSDGSEKIADLLAKEDTRIKVVHHQKNRKLGGVLKTGFSVTSKEIVIYTDMDMPFDFTLLKNFVGLVKDADIINGYRTDYRESFRRLLYSKVYNNLVRAIFGLKVRDVNFSMKIYRKEVLAALDLKSEGSFINAEALAKAQYAGYKIKEVPVNYRPRLWGTSRLSSFTVIIKIIYEMARFFPELLAVRLKMRYLYLRANLHNSIRKKTCPFSEIAKYVPREGDIYDLGCGYGIFVDFLIRHLPEDGFRFIGLDTDALKIKFASLANKKNNIIFKTGDITKELELSNAQCIIMLDVLMLLPFIKQEELLYRCFRYLSGNGILLIKEIDTHPRWKYLWHQFQETFVLKVFRLIQGEGLYCRSRQDYLSLFKKIGFRVNLTEIQEGYPYPHVLYICSKN